MGAGSIGTLAPISTAPEIRGTAVPAAVAQFIGEAVLAANDSVSSALLLIATPQISDLLLQIERQLKLDPDVSSKLLREAVSAVHDRDTVRALGKLSELIALAPERAPTLPAEPALAPIRGQILNLLQRVNAELRVHADRVLAAASHALGAQVADSHRVENFHLRGVLALANRLAETGQTMNLVRASELATAVMSYCGPSAAAPGFTAALKLAAKRRNRGLASLRLIERGAGLVRVTTKMWRRAPLVVLVLVWTMAGILAWIASSAMGFGAWGVGLVALVAFGFYRSIRRLRF